MFPLRKTLGLGYGGLTPSTYSTAAPAITVDPHQALLDGTDNTVAATLAAPGTQFIGSPIFVRVTNADNAVTLALTTVTGATTLTLAVGDAFVIFGASATQWGFLNLPASYSEPATSKPSITALTDNSGGTATNTLADVTEANNAGSSDRVPTEDAIASLAAKINEIRTVLSNYGIIS